MIDPTIPCLDEVRSAQTFERGAECLARHAFSVVAEALHGSPTRPLRAMVHLRPEGGYLGLVWYDPDGAADPAPSLTPSSSAWHTLREHLEPVHVDVVKRTFEPESGPAEQRPFPRDRLGRGSQQILIDRLTTHLLAVPLWGAGGTLIGMVSIEASDMGAVGRARVFGDAARRLDRLTRQVGPALAVLPNAPLPPPDADELLPVAGPSMAQTLETLRRFAPLDTTLLLMGPTGVGKSEIVSWIVQRSRRAGMPLVTFHVAGQGVEKLESELFGWVRGAFTGAIADRQGLVAFAEGGTLFLDEIDKCPLDAQAGLLQLLGNRTWRRRGEDRDHSSDVRFVLAANRDLRELVASGQFLEDLYYRIAGLEVRIPSLDERSDEIGAWASWLARRARRRNGRTGDVILTPEARALLRAAPWPGNLRQLESAVMLAATLAEAEGDRDQETLTLTDAHVRLALGGARTRSARDQATVDRALRSVARAIVSHLASRPRPFDHRLLDALKGYVAEEAIGRLGEREATRALGREALLRGSNHLPWLRGEVDQAAAMRAELGDLPTDG